MNHRNENKSSADFALSTQLVKAVSEYRSGFVCVCAIETVEVGAGGRCGCTTVVGLSVIGYTSPSSALDCKLLVI